MKDQRNITELLQALEKVDPSFCYSATSDSWMVGKSNLFLNWGKLSDLDWLLLFNELIRRCNYRRIKPTLLCELDGDKTRYLWALRMGSIYGGSSDFDIEIGLLQAYVRVLENTEALADKFATLEKFKAHLEQKGLTLEIHEETHATTGTPGYFAVVRGDGRTFCSGSHPYPTPLSAAKAAGGRMLDTSMIEACEASEEGA